MAESQQHGQMTDERLIALIEQYEGDALGSPVAAGAAVGSAMPADRQMTTLQVDQYNAINTYYARPNGTEEEGKSSIVLPEMRDTVEWEVPQLMRIFTAGPVCQFDPCGPDDVKPAQLETAAVQHIFMEQNPGFLIIHDLIKDARMLRNGYARAMVETQSKSEVITYTGLDEMQLAKVMRPRTDEKQDVLGQRQYVDNDEQDQQPPQMPGQPPMPGAPPPPQRWDLKVRRTKKRRAIRIDCMPPEEMLIHAQCRGSLDESRFVQHHSYVTRSELIEDGYDEDVVNALPGETEPSTELVPLARMVVTDQLAVTDPTDRAAQTICKRDIVMQVDYDGDGVAELRHIVLGHKAILENEEVDEVCYVGGATTRMPHRHTGLSAYDDLGDIQAIKTDLARGLLDNARLVSNPRLGVDFQNASMEDLMTSRDGGVMRSKGDPHAVFMPIEVPFIGDKILPIMETVDGWREMRTGVGRDTVGLDPDVLQDVTKGAALAGMAAASLKLELKARMLAETLFAPLFCKIHNLVRKHPDVLKPFQYRGEWIDLDPTEWNERESVSPAVGLGSGQREEMRQSLLLLTQLQEKLFMAATSLPPPLYKRAYASFARMCEMLGFNQPQNYGLDPESADYGQFMQQAAQSHQQAAQGPAQVQQLKNQGNLQVEQARQQTAAITQNAETQRTMAQLNKEIMVENQGQQHEVMAQGRQHAADMSQAQLSAATQIGLKVMDFMSRIEAAKAKNDPSVNGQTLATDTRAAEGAL